MTLRTALVQSRWLTFALLAVGAWIVLMFLRVLDITTRGLTAGGTGEAGVQPIGEFVGQAWIPGIVGALVLLTMLGFAVVLFSELGEAGPLPEPFPPEDTD